MSVKWPVRNPALYDSGVDPSTKELMREGWCGKGLHCNVGNDCSEELHQNCLIQMWILREGL